MRGGLKMVKQTKIQNRSPWSTQNSSQYQSLMSVTCTEPSVHSTLRMPQASLSPSAAEACSVGSLIHHLQARALRRQCLCNLKSSSLTSSSDVWPAAAKTDDVCTQSHWRNGWGQRIRPQAQISDRHRAPQQDLLCIDTVRKWSLCYVTQWLLWAIFTLGLFQHSKQSQTDDQRAFLVCIWTC